MSIRLVRIVIRDGLIEFELQRHILQGSIAFLEAASGGQREFLALLMLRYLTQVPCHQIVDDLAATFGLGRSDLNVVSHMCTWPFVQLGH